MNHYEILLDLKKKIMQMILTNRKWQKVKHISILDFIYFFELQYKI